MISPSHDELMRMHELAALRDERDALKAENERLRDLYENAVINKGRFGFTINHLLECDEARRTVEQEAERLRFDFGRVNDRAFEHRAEIERLREALVITRQCLHEACLKLGTTDGYRAGFDAASAALNSGPGRENVA